MRKKSRVKRIDADLDREIRSVAEKNMIGYTEACREIARVIKRNKNRKHKREIVF